MRLLELDDFPLTRERLEKLFGEQMPVEAVDLMMHPGHRDRVMLMHNLNEMAKDWNKVEPNWVGVTRMGSPHAVEMDINRLDTYRHRLHGEEEWIPGRPLA